MNKKKLCILLLALSLLIAAIPVSAYAAEGDHALDVLLSEKPETAASNGPAVSMALNVLAAQNDMTVAGIKGNILNFSAERFACAMNLSKVESVTVVSLPDSLCGALYLGSEVVEVGRQLAGRELSLLTYEEGNGGIGKSTSFDFRVNESSYVMSCNIHMIDDLNYSPTVKLASPVSLDLETYEGVTVTGVLSAYDPEGDSMTFEIVRYPANGRLTLTDASAGCYTYTPGEGFTGEDSFRYVAVDQYGNYSSWQSVSLTVAAQGTSAVYRDLFDSEYHPHAIAMTECGIMNGVRVGDHYYFEADRQVSRAEFLITAMNAMGIQNLPDVTATVFADDADINPEMKSYASLAYEKGYISGRETDGALCFAPNEPIKLAEAAVILSNMIGYAEPKVAYDLEKAVPAWSEKAIVSLCTLGILEARDMSNGAGEIMSRGEMAKLLNKAMYVIGR